MNMKRMKKKTINHVLSIVLGACISVFSVQAQNSNRKAPTLGLGDPAPPIVYSKWIQGPKPINKIENDKIYVFEFWATWCGPCIQAMPHLSELAKKYQGKIDFIGCDVWENSHGGDKPQEGYLPKVTEFVAQQFKLGRLTYNVIADNNAEDMGNKWLKAAGQNGIQASFVIQNGKIAWIGHPVYLDAILESIVAGKYDVEAVKKEAADKAAEAKKYAAQQAAGIKLYKDAVAEKNYEKAIAMADTAIARYPNFTYIFAIDKFKMLNEHFSEDRAITYGRELMKDHFLAQIMALAFMDGKLAQTQKMKEFAIETAKNMDPEGKNCRVVSLIAQYQAAAGHDKEAAATAWKAVEAAKAEAKDPKSNGAMTQEEINVYIEKAETYQKKAEGKSE